MRATFRAMLLAAALAAPMAGSVGATVPSETQTSCLAIAHIGDSISAGMESPTHLADEELRLRARYEDIGATDVRFDISGARSVVEHLAGQRNGAEAARRLRDEGFTGCWVVALGTNDAANVAVGSGYGYSERIDRMMEIIGDDRWCGSTSPHEPSRVPMPAATCNGSTPPSPRPHARYPAIRVFGWSDVVADEWFLPDGIHYTSDGSAHGAALVAAAVADAFPVAG